MLLNSAIQTKNVAYEGVSFAFVVIISIYASLGARFFL